MNDALVEVGHAGPENSGHANQLSLDFAIGILGGQHEARPEMDPQPLDQSSADICGQAIATLEVTTLDQLVVEQGKRRFDVRIDAQNQNGDG